MKKVLLIATLLVGAFTIQAQKIKVSETTDKIADGTNNVMKVMIYEADKDQIEKEWKDWMKKSGGKVSIKSEMVMTGGTFKSLGEKPCDIYARIDSKGDAFELTVGVDLGGAFLNSGAHGEQYKSFSNELEKFAKEVTSAAIGNQVKEAEKLLKDEEKNLSKLEGDKKNLENDIEKYKDAIKKAEEDIKKNEEDQAKTKAEVEAKKKAVEAVKAKANKYN